MISCKNDNQTRSCDLAIVNLIEDSNYNNLLISDTGTNGTIIWDSIHARVQSSDESQNIQLYFLNEDKREVTIGWFKVKFEQNLILDVSMDEINPDTVFIKKNRLENIIEKGCFRK